MRVVIIFLLIVAIIYSFVFVVANINNEEIKIKNSEEYKFSTFTSAVCKQNESLVFCKDEVFVDCNGYVSKAIDIAECNGIKLDVPKATGFAVFGEGWKDPRNG